jgi:hypothetical protein
MSQRIIISGAISHYPLGGAGNAWAFLQYLLGFQQLGFETYCVEQLNAKDWVDDAGQPATFANSVNARFFQYVMEQFGLHGRASLLANDGDAHLGLSLTEVEKIAADSVLLINLSGRLQLPGILRAVRRRLYLDLDPGYTQIWQTQYGVDMNLRGHDVYVTVGLNLGQPGCPLPTCGLEWKTTLPPVVLREWETNSPAGEAYSTIADWRGFKPIEWQGIWYGQKADEFLRLLNLPRRVTPALELCLLINDNEPDRETMTRNGWRLVSPLHHAATPTSYREYIVHARGEFTVVKPGYALGHSGWFSDRSACYLAAGRPVIMQDTGVGRYLPVQAGLLTFTDMESAVAAIEQVEGNYAEHAEAAVALAREYLDANRVLAQLLRLADV